MTINVSRMRHCSSFAPLGFSPPWGGITLFKKHWSNRSTETVACYVIRETIMLALSERSETSAFDLIY